MNVSLASASTSGIAVIKAPLPECSHLRFEYHPHTGKVYWMPQPAPGARVHAFVLAEHCDSVGRAWGAVQTFCRGYRQGAMESPREVRA